jgi:hypothetical protein
MKSSELTDLKSLLISSWNLFSHQRSTPVLVGIEDKSLKEEK